MILYESMIRHVALRLGLQGANGADACQDVLLKLCQAVKSWVPDSKPASFRRWLYRVARNAMLNFIKSNCRSVALANNLTIKELSRLSDCEMESVFDVEFLRQSLVFLAQKIKNEFAPVNWSAFWLTYGQQLSVEDTAKKLAISKSRVYVARSRIIRRLSYEAERLSDNDWFNIKKIAIEAEPLEARKSEDEPKDYEHPVLRPRLG